MTDIVERLRATDVGYPTDRVARDAADEIERLRAALRKIIDAEDHLEMAGIAVGAHEQSTDGNNG